MKIRGSTVGTTMPRPDWNQTDPKKADYIFNKPDIPAVTENDNGKLIGVVAGRMQAIALDDTLAFSEGGVLSVNTADEPEADNTRPITAAAVHTTVGNIEVLLGTI